MRSHSIFEIEALRGVLALWVLLHHVTAVTEVHLPEPIRDVLHGGNAVQLFIMISGFVIAKLLRTGRDNYRQYVVRRFFRLFPAYMLFVTLAIILAEAGIVGKNYSAHDFPLLLAAHATMLQGVLPEALVPNATSAFLLPTWSITLEWQFYLLAPLLVPLVLRSPLWFAVSCACLIVHKQLILPHLAPFWGGAFLLSSLFSFWVGIASYGLYERLSSRDDGHVIALCACAAFLMIATAAIPFRQNVVLFIWPAFLALIIASPKLEPRSALGRAMSLIKGPAALWLGTISYSIYLAHGPVMSVTQWALEAAWPESGMERNIVIVLPITLAATVLVASITYMLLEQPLNAFGKRISRPRDPGRTAFTPPQAAP